MANYVFNSASSGEAYNAKCLNVSDDSEWTPSAAEYPQDGTIDLSGGTSGRYLDTQWVAPPDEPWSLTLVYNVVSGVSHDIAILDYNGDNTADVWYGDQDTVPVLTPENTGLDYTPPLGNYLITEVPDLPVAGDGLGEELYSNPNMDTGITGWKATDPGTVATWDDVGQTLLATSSSTSGIYQNPDALAVEIGKDYRFSAEVKDTDLTPWVRGGTAVSGTQYFSTEGTLSSPQVFEEFFTATTSSFYVYLRNDGAGFTNWDNLSLKEVLAVGPTAEFSNIADITDELAHTVTITFSVPPVGLELADFVIDETVGTLSNLVQTGTATIWTLDYTANTLQNDISNTITLPAGSYTDGTDPSGKDAVSNVFAVDTGGALPATDIYDRFTYQPGSGVIVTPESGDAGISFEIVADGTGTSGGAVVYLWVSPTTTANSTCELIFNASIANGSPVISQIKFNNGSTDFTDVPITEGENILPIPLDASGGSAYALVYFQADISYTVTLSDVAITEEI